MTGTIRVVNRVHNSYYNDTKKCFYSYRGCKNKLGAIVFVDDMTVYCPECGIKELKERKEFQFKKLLMKVSRIRYYNKLIKRLESGIINEECLSLDGG